MLEYIILSGLCMSRHYLKKGYTPVMSCLLKIRSIRDDMSAIEKKLADFILKDSRLLRDYSSQQLATAVGVSQSSVVKFCQKLGYKGYPDFKLAINEAVAISSNGKTQNRNNHFTNLELNRVSDQLLQAKLSAVMASIELNQESIFIEAIGAIKKAKRIQVFGNGVSSFVAQHFAHGLIHCGKVTFSSTDPIYQMQFIETLESDDLLIMLNATEEVVIQQEILLRVREKGINTLRIGRYSPSSNYHVNDICLSTITDIAQEDGFDVVKRAAQQHIVDILLTMSLKNTA